MGTMGAANSFRFASLSTSLKEGGIVLSMPLLIPKGSLLEGMKLAARSAGGRQAKCRRSVSEAD